jgi:hypothetical protein
MAKHITVASNLKSRDALWIIYIGEVCYNTVSDSHGTVLALATLGDATQIGSFLFISFGQGK